MPQFQDLLKNSRKKKKTIYSFKGLLVRLRNPRIALSKSEEFLPTGVPWQLRISSKLSSPSFFAWATERSRRFLRSTSLPFLCTVVAAVVCIYIYIIIFIIYQDTQRNAEIGGFLLLKTKQTAFLWVSWYLSKTSEMAPLVSNMLGSNHPKETDFTTRRGSQQVLATWYWSKCWTLLKQSAILRKLL